MIGRIEKDAFPVRDHLTFGLVLSLLRVRRVSVRVYQADDRQVSETHPVL